MSAASSSMRENEIDLGNESTSRDTAFSDRVRLFLKVMFFINLFFAVAAALTTASGLGRELQADDPVQLIINFVVTALNGMAWFAIARSRHSLLTAILTQALFTIMIVGAYSYLLLQPGADLGRHSALFVLLIVTIVLVLRATIVPAPTIAATVIGTISMTIALVNSVLALPDEPLAFHIWLGLVAVVVIAVTTVASHTIFGLHRQVRLVRNLGQYRVDKRIGHGGMGEVFLATHSLLQRPTALKLLRNADSASARERFRDEVQTASGLTHPNTVEIYDYGRTPEGVFYFAMEYVEGATLNQVVDASGPMLAARVVHLLMQAAGSLSEAHGRGLVHRDIKPSNLMLCERGGMFDTLKVLDFGLVHDVASLAVGDAGSLTGTPLYLAPEAILESHGFVPESDVYALGATAYFLLTGAPPFPGHDLTEVLSDHLATVPAEPPSDDPELARLVMSCLAKDPAERPADAGMMLDALRECSSYDAWSPEDARVWWSEHRYVVEATRDA
ncbi:MAG: hypothetical protein ACI9KE_002768 [Polyangiales bacterium]|jgi:hypothetical protein